MKICSIVGARPQFIKVATLSRVIKNRKDIDEIMIHTGQHYDDNMSKVFFEQLKIPQPHYNLAAGGGHHGLQTGKILQALEPVLVHEKPNLVIVYGDTNSTLAGTLTAVKLNIPVAHVEAGLRSFNRDMPEEINRIVTDHIADFLFAPTRTAMDFLAKEGLSEHSVFSGDVMYDSVKFFSKSIRQRRPFYHDYYLTTIHRPANTDNANHLLSILEAFHSFQKKIILPAHPRLRRALNQLKIPNNVQIIEPVGYLDMLNLLFYSDLVLTDSGGLQKESFFLNKKCITLRDETEWPETLENNWNMLVGADKEKICNAEKVKCGEYNIIEKFGNGHAAEQIIDYLLKESFKC
ncbi:MAG: UDP-N-acetylglucosamine 2-epimerase (non-hydrolyzing) [Candidatus Marinimicrobia bacterium]|nr:UDP-N-acetylglucosamine 2-epimerase (non-hydrolyzing) [Candidatus Neomarinimicrobiota bacterium]